MRRFWRRKKQAPATSHGPFSFEDIVRELEQSPRWENVRLGWDHSGDKDELPSIVLAGRTTADNPLKAGQEVMFGFVLDSAALGFLKDRIRQWERLNPPKWPL